MISFHALDSSEMHPFITLAVVVFCLALYHRTSKPNQDKLPVLGSIGLRSYIDGYRYIHHAREILQNGYHKFKGGAFKIALPDKWLVIVTPPDMINEIRLAKNEDLSFHVATAEKLQSKYTIGKNTMENAYHADVIRAPLTRNLGPRFAEVYDEIVHAFDDLVPTNGQAITALPTMQRIVCRTSNRLFLGLPICRDPEWVTLNIRYTIDVFTKAALTGCFPKFLKPLVGRWISPTSKAVQVGRKLLGEEIKRRIQMDSEHGKKYDGRPNDLISWLLDFAQDEERQVDSIIIRLLLVNIAAIHTTTNIFTEALFNLAAYPEYVNPMRDEVLRIVEKEGWTKTSVGKMHKVESFLKETARMDGINGVQLMRTVVNPAGYTLSNGVYLPYNTVLGVPIFAIHHDSQFYNDPSTFDGFRFSKPRDGEDDIKHQMTATSINFLSFGHGKYACPGRFFAVNELKALLAHVLVTYDVTLEGNAKPNCYWFAHGIMPDPNAKLKFTRLKP